MPSAVDYKLTVNAIQVAALRQAIDLAVSINAGDLGPVLYIYASHRLSVNDLEEARVYLMRAQTALTESHETATHKAARKPDNLQTKLNQMINGDGGHFGLTFAERDRLIEVTEIGFRIMMGQLSPILDAFLYLRTQGRSAQFDVAEADLGRMHFLLTGMCSYEWHSIRSDIVTDTARVLYDIRQVLRHQVALERHFDHWHLSSDVPCRTSHTTEFPAFEALESLDTEQISASVELKGSPPVDIGIKPELRRRGNHVRFRNFIAVAWNAIKPDWLRRFSVPVSPTDQTRSAAP
jgi:hypothetical protein